MTVVPILSTSVMKELIINTFITKSKIYSSSFEREVHH